MFAFRITPGAVLALVVLSACKPETGPPDYGLSGYDPTRFETQRALCESKGGRFAPDGVSGAYACFENTHDANKVCTASSQCEGLCLARSGTCAPVKPLFGCQDVLNDTGFRETLCIE